MQTIKEYASNFLSSLPCHIQKPYPSPHISAKNAQVADALLNAYADGGNAELTAITQYFNHALTIKDENVSNLVFCIGLVEMHHLKLIGEMIESLGGELRYWRANHSYWTAGNVNYGSTTCGKLSLDILAEQEALSGYEAILREVISQNNPALNQVEDVITRIMEDEAYHLTLFTDAYNSLCNKQE